MNSIVQAILETMMKHAEAILSKESKYGRRDVVRIMVISFLFVQIHSYFEVETSKLETFPSKVFLSVFRIIVIVFAGEELSFIRLTFVAVKL